MALLLIAIVAISSASVGFFGCLGAHQLALERTLSSRHLVYVTCPLLLCDMVALVARGFYSLMKKLAYACIAGIGLTLLPVFPLVLTLSSILKLVLARS